MPDVYTTGSWKPFPGQEEAFVEAWTEFASWASELPGAGTALLARDFRDAERFVSFMDWESMAAVRGWKDSPEFKERMGRVQKPSTSSHRPSWSSWRDARAARR